jgi:hypothetical protein
MLKNKELERFKNSLAQNIILYLDLNNFERDFSKKYIFFLLLFWKKV